MDYLKDAFQKDSYNKFYVNLLNFIPKAPALSLPRSSVLLRGPRANRSLKL